MVPFSIFHEPLKCVAHHIGASFIKTFQYT